MNQITNKQSQTSETTYSVEGEPGTWSRHADIESAIVRAKELGVPVVHSVRSTAHRSGATGIDKRVVWASLNCPECLLPADVSSIARG